MENMVERKENKRYESIEWFKLLAALLVIAIHTSPLESINGMADFILTRTIARVAVPFFMMVTGYFALPKCLESKAYRRHYIQKTACIYLAAMLIYLPVNIYAGYFKGFTMAGLLKDILVNGTFYHLWYLPGVLTGLILVIFMIQHLGEKKTLFAAIALYGIGLLGDSYYGMLDNTLKLKELYEGLFRFCDYTRNGFFYVPVFLVLGYWIRKKKKAFQIEEKILCIVFLFGTIAEGVILHQANMQRHDSMYICLVPLMYYLFQWLLHLNAKPIKAEKDFFMYLYILHPFVIIVLRGTAKFLGIYDSMIKSSLLYYFFVVAGTAALADSILLLKNIVKSKRDRFKIFAEKKQIDKDRAWLEIHLINLKYNVMEIKKILPEECGIMAVVKANAYGHGDVQVANYLSKIGVKAFAVATLCEGIRLRKAGVEGEILILGYTKPENIKKLRRYNLIQTVVDGEYAQVLNGFQVPIDVHIKVNTGMNRLGEKAGNTEQIEKIFACENLKVKGIYSHLCVADSNKEADVLFTKQQFYYMQEVLNKLKADGYDYGKTHMQSSYGILNYPEMNFDYARPGILLYGVLSNTEKDTIKSKINLRPVLSLKSRVSSVKDVLKGETVGYGNTFQAEKNMRLAVISVGYADGIPRNLSNGKSAVLIHGVKAPVVGMICMDQLMVDVTGIPDLQAGDVVTLIGTEGKETITVEELAQHAGTITNELLSRLGGRLERCYIT